ncbi:MAG: HD domain-containing protein [Spirochaetia bacterium]|nr:HD domain-containing protein [Spirochaetia bacterium]
MLVFLKFHIACISITLFIILIYLKNILGNKIKCNYFFNNLVFFSLLEIICDGTTYYTVNHPESCSPAVNLILHGLFFISLDLNIFAVFLYILNYVREIPSKKRYGLLIFSPLIISLVIVLIFLKDIYYVEGKYTNYSMGISVYACFICMFIYFCSLLGVLFARLKYIEQKKRFSFIFTLFVAFFVMLLQFVYPEFLVTAFLSVLILLGFYISLEDPYIKKLNTYNNYMVTNFANLVENRDNNTGGHIIRTQKYVTLLLKKMKNSREFQSIITRDFENNMINAAPLHDIGKISTPDNILQKPGKLTDEEFSIMKMHTIAGSEIIIDSFGNLENKEFLNTAYDVARYHHEKWNGKGYPEGLKEKKIPLCARIMAIADVFDAVSADRCYRAALPLEKCFQIIQEGSGSDFDPALVKLFMEAKSDVMELYAKNS